MATFKVGQRVRLIAERSPFVGAEGVIVGTRHGDRHGTTRFPAIALAFFYMATFGEHGGPYACLPEELAPLTDPRASEFIADMERYAHVAKTTKVTA